MVERDAAEPGGEGRIRRVCFVGGWIGGPEKTARIERNEEMAVVLEDGTQMSFDKAFEKFGDAEIDDIHRDVMVRYEFPDGRHSEFTMRRRLFAHANYQDIAGDLNVHNVAEGIVLRLPKGKNIDTTPWDRTIYTPKFSESEAFIDGRNTLPTVIFVRKEVLDELQVSPAINRVMDSARGAPQAGIAAWHMGLG